MEKELFIYSKKTRSYLYLQHINVNYMADILFTNTSSNAHRAEDISHMRGKEEAGLRHLEEIDKIYVF
jgi:hypothetical protein